MLRPRGARLFGFAALTVLVLDQITKGLVIRYLAPNEPWPAADTVIGRVFSMTHVYNTGVAFGLFQGRSELFVAVALVVVAALLFYRHRLPAEDRWLQVALGLQVGGALGNLTDRLRIGHVTDFLDFKVWPVFNISDTAIVTGVLLLAWRLWLEERSTADRASVPSQQSGRDSFVHALEDPGD